MLGRDRLKQIGYIGLVAFVVTAAFHAGTAVVGLVLGRSLGLFGC